MDRVRRRAGSIASNSLAHFFAAATPGAAGFRGAFHRNRDEFMCRWQFE
jgi:hypothetical protein